MKKILVVDDERDIRYLLSTVLGDAGYHVLLADSGERALALLVAERPNLVLLDLMMPGMDGREVLKRIRRLPKGKRVPVMIMSCCSAPDLRGCSECAFLAKPFDYDQLLATIERLLNAGGQRQRKAKHGAEAPINAALLRV